MTVRAHKFSKSAQEKITQAGGKCELIHADTAKLVKPAAGAKKK